MKGYMMRDSKKFWDNQAKRFDSNDNSETEMLIKKSLKYFSENDTVLDFACGTGTSTVDIAKSVKKIYDIDLSDNMIQIANKKIEDKDLLNVDFKVATLEDDSLINDSYDVIVAYNIIHLLEDTKGSVKRIYDLLKTGGLFISNTACLGEKKGIMRSIFKFVSKIGIVPDIKLFSFNELTEIINVVGFSNIEAELSKDSIPNAFIVVKK